MQGRKLQAGKVREHDRRRVWGRWRKTGKHVREGRKTKRMRKKEKGEEEASRDNKRSKGAA